MSAHTSTNAATVAQQLRQKLPMNNTKLGRWSQLKRGWRGAAMRWGAQAHHFERFAELWVWPFLQCCCWILITVTEGTKQGMSGR